MKRRIGVCLSAISLLAACGQPPDHAAEKAPGPDGWARTVTLEQADLQQRAVVVAGRAGPGARVVLRVVGDDVAAGDDAFAVSAGEDGRFVLRIPTAGSDRLFSTEVQTGQEAARSGGFLLTAASAGRVVAILTPGEGSRRLDAGGLIEAIDHDGRVMLASGAAVAGSRIEVAVDGRPVASATAGPTGRWQAGLGQEGLQPVRVSVSVAARTVEVGYPGAGQPQAGSLTVERAGAGVRATWRTPDGATQTAWFPDLQTTSR